MVAQFSRPLLRQVRQVDFAAAESGCWRALCSCSSAKPTASRVHARPSSRDESLAAYMISPMCSMSPASLHISSASRMGGALPSGGGGGYCGGVIHPYMLDDTCSRIFTDGFPLLPCPTRLVLAIAFGMARRARSTDTKMGSATATSPLRALYVAYAVRHLRRFSDETPTKRDTAAWRIAFRSSRGKPFSACCFVNSVC